MFYHGYRITLAEYTRKGDPIFFITHARDPHSPILAEASSISQAIELIRRSEAEGGFETSVLKSA
jgi:hypothetical protein